jgi:hypothetical protein
MVSAATVPLTKMNPNAYTAPYRALSVASAVCCAGTLGPMSRVRIRDSCC